MAGGAGKPSPAADAADRKTVDWGGGILSFQNSKDRVCAEANPSDFLFCHEMFVFISVIFTRSTLFPFILTDLETEPPPSEEGHGCRGGRRE